MGRSASAIRKDSVLFFLASCILMPVGVGMWLATMKQYNLPILIKIIILIACGFAPAYLFGYWLLSGLDSGNSSFQIIIVAAALLMAPFFYSFVYPKASQHN